MRRFIPIRAVLAAALLAGMLLAAPTGAAEEGKGKLVLTAENWQAMLLPTPKGKALRVTGGKEGVEVAAGTYRLYFQISASSDPKTPSATISGSLKDPVTIEAGKTAEIKVGAPVEAAIATQAKGKKVTFSLGFKDAGGNDVTVMAAPEGKKQVEPKIDVVDKDGKTVYTATMAFG